MSRTSAPTPPYTPVDVGCTHCAQTVTDFDDVLGHDGVGHRARSALLRAGYYTRELIAHATDRELLGVRELGPVGLARVRSVVPAPRRTVRLPSQMPTPPAARIPYTPATLRDRLPIGIDINDQMLENSATAASLWILTSISHTDPRIWKHVDHLGIDTAAILREHGWTWAQRGLIAVARHLSSSSKPKFDLNLLIGAIDDECWDALLEALRIHRAGLRGAQ